MEMCRQVDHRPARVARSWGQSRAIAEQRGGGAAPGRQLLRAGTATAGDRGLVHHDILDSAWYGSLGRVGGALLGGRQAFSPAGRLYVSGGLGSTSANLELEWR